MGYTVLKWHKFKSVLHPSEFENLATYKLYQELLKRIKKITRKAKALRKGDESNPAFWISEKCLSEINNNFGLRENLFKTILAKRLYS